MTYYLFAKFFQHLSTDELMQHCVEAGLDGPTALIRDGYWIEDTNLTTALPAFVRRAESAGLEVRFASTGFSLEELAADSTPLRVLADNGITAARVGYIRKNATPHVRDLHEHVHSLMARVAESASGCGVRIVVQIQGVPGRDRDQRRLQAAFRRSEQRRERLAERVRAGVRGTE